MSATLEMISLLSDDLSATEVDPLDLLSVLRRRGVRRQKNNPVTVTVTNLKE